jgi:hypothetical protein
MTKSENREIDRVVRCCPLLVFTAASQDFVMKSHIILHSLTSAKGISHEIALDKVAVRSVKREP